MNVFKYGLGELVLFFGIGMAASFIPFGWAGAMFGGFSVLFAAMAVSCVTTYEWFQAGQSQSRNWRFRIAVLGMLILIDLCYAFLITYLA